MLAAQQRERADLQMQLRALSSLSPYLITLALRDDLGHLTVAIGEPVEAERPRNS